MQELKVVLLLAATPLNFMLGLANLATGENIFVGCIGLGAGLIGTAALGLLMIRRSSWDI